MSSYLTLEQWKESIQSESKNIVSWLERGQNTPTNIHRLEKINEMLEIIEKVEKGDSILKKMK